jgi:general secretion pathway protein H
MLGTTTLKLGRVPASWSRRRTRGEVLSQGACASQDGGRRGPGWPKATEERSLAAGSPERPTASTRPSFGRRAKRGLTLIEITVALAIAALIVGVGLVSMNALTDADLKSSAVELTGAIKFSYDRSIMEKRTQRMGFDISKGLWWLDYTDDPYAFDRERTRGKTGAESPDAVEAKKEKPSTLDEIFEQSDDPEAEVKQVMEGGKALAFSPDEGGGPPRRLPGNVSFSKVWTGHQEEPFTEGVAYLHFFRSGWTEPAQIELTDGDGDYITLKVFPLTGRVRMYKKQIEDEKVEEDDGREEGDE